MKENYAAPIPLALLTCDNIITDLRTRKKSLIGLFNSVGASAYPYLMREFFVFVSMTNCEGETDISIKLQAADGDVVFNLPGKIPAQNLLESPEVIFNIQNLVIKAPGSYELILTAGGVQIASRMLTFKQLACPKPPQDKS